MNILPTHTVLLTGASGGIGAYITRAFAMRKTNLALVASPGMELDRVREEAERHGARAIRIVADLRDPDQRHLVVEHVEREFGKIDILVNNAGIEYTEPYHQLTEESILDVLSVNLEAPMILSRLVLPGMLKNGQGHIVNISSLAGKGGPAFEETYSSSKAGLIAFTSSLRASYRGTGVSASVIVPGFVEAGIYAKLKQNSGCTAPGLLGTSSPEAVADAVIQAILRDRFELIVNPRPVRPILAISSIFPALGEWLIEKTGSNDFFRRVVAATRAGESTEEAPEVEILNHSDPKQKQKNSVK